MRILYYLSRFPGWGGIETVTEILGNKLLEMGHQIDLLTHLRQDRQSDMLNKVHYYVMPDEGKWNTPDNRNFAIQLVQDNNYNVIIFQDSYAEMDQIAIQMKKANGTPLIVCEHSMPSYNSRNSLLFINGVSFPLKLYRRLYSVPKQLMTDRKRHSKLLKESDAYVVLSKGYIQELCDICRVQASDDIIRKIHFINNPFIPALTGTKTLCPKENIILFVGQVNYVKRVELMIDAWKRLCAYAKDWRFLIVGDGPLRESLAQKVIDERIVGIEFCGFQQPKEYYQKAAIFWMTSSFEGWAMTLVEAMSAGCVPVGMNTYSSIKDIIDDGRNGFVTSDNNLDAFVEKTIVLMENKNYREQMAISAMGKVKQYDIAKIINQWQNLINLVTNS